MSLPPLYKYLDVEGAKLTLQNGNLKHAKPSDFNDLEDLTIRSIFPESDEAALQEIKDNFTDVLLNNLDRAPTCLNVQMRQQIALLQKVYRENPGAAKAIKEIVKGDAISALYDLDGLKERSKGFYMDAVAASSANANLPMLKYQESTFSAIGSERYSREMQPLPTRTGS